QEALRTNRARRSSRSVGSNSRSSRLPATPFHPHRGARLPVLPLRRGGVDLAGPADPAQGVQPRVVAGADPARVLGCRIVPRSPTTPPHSVADLRAELLH